MINDAIGNGASTPAASGAAAGPARASERTAPAQAGPGGGAAPQREHLEAAVSQLNDYVQSIQRTLSFSIEESTGRTVVKVFDAETDELIRQIPPEETLKIAAALQEQTVTLFVKERA